MIITGVSRNGLGEAMARAIASKSPSLLVLAARSTSKAEAVSKHLGVDFPFVDTRLLSLNLSSQKSVRQAAIELKYMTKAVDVLMNNAAVVAVYERTLSEDGEEIQFAINYMVYFLFTNLIMNKLPLSANQIPQSGARMSTLLALGTSSHPCDLAIIDLRGDRSLMKSSQTRPWLHERGCLNWTHRVIAYCQSDTANTLFTTELGANLYEQGRLISAPGGNGAGLGPSRRFIC